MKHLQMPPLTVLPFISFHIFAYVWTYTIPRASFLCTIGNGSSIYIPLLDKVVYFVETLNLKWVFTVLKIWVQRQTNCFVKYQFGAYAIDFMTS